jgi:glutathione S-transferase
LSLAQSGAITRHLAREHGYYGTSAQEAALIDQAAEGVVDIRTRVIQAVFRTPEEQKAEARAQLLADYLPGQLAIFSKLLEKNGDNGFLVGSKVPPKINQTELLTSSSLARTEACC